MLCEEWKLWIVSGVVVGMVGVYYVLLVGSLFIVEILFGILMLVFFGLVVVFVVVVLLIIYVLNGSDLLFYIVYLIVDFYVWEYVMIVSIGLVVGLCGLLLMWLMMVSYNSFLCLKLFLF